MKLKIAIVLLISLWQGYCFSLSETKLKSKLTYSSLSWPEILNSDPKDIFVKMNIEIRVGYNDLTIYYGINEWMETAEGKPIRSWRRHENELENNYLNLYENLLGHQTWAEIHYTNRTYLNLLELEYMVLTHQIEYNKNEIYKGYSMPLD